MKLEAVITGRRLALGASERVLLLRPRMQEDREILAHRPETLRGHLLGGRAHHHVVAVLHGHAEQFVADRTAYSVDIHGCGSNSAITFVSRRAASIQRWTAGSAVTRAA